MVKGKAFTWTWCPTAVSYADCEFGVRCCWDIMPLHHRGCFVLRFALQVECTVVHQTAVGRTRCFRFQLRNCPVLHRLTYTFSAGSPTPFRFRCLPMSTVDTRFVPNAGCSRRQVKPAGPLASKCHPNSDGSARDQILSHSQEHIQAIFGACFIFRTKNYLSVLIE